MFDMSIFMLTERMAFPPVELADDDGLLAVGGDLSVERLLLAYRSGIFPWYSEGEPLLWWSPDPRFVLFPDRLKISNSMSRILKSECFAVTVDRDFRAVIEQCRTVERVDQPGTWITPEMCEAYCLLHEEGSAHSVEVWQNNELVGGLYGISIGHAFFGESMFTKVSNASKAGLITLVQRLDQLGFTLVDCQIISTHLTSLGAEQVDRKEFLRLVSKALKAETPDLSIN